MENINWDDFNYDDINWNEIIKRYFNSDNDGINYNEDGSIGGFDPNVWYQPEHYKLDEEELEKWNKFNTSEEAIYYENTHLYESLCGLTDMPSNKAKRIIENDNIFHSGKDKIIKELISYFEELEEYEKCANLLKLL